MKFNWGVGVTVFFLSFVFLMIFLGYKSFQTNFDLVYEDYYLKEIQFQDVIEKQTNESKLTETVTINKTNSGFEVNFPANQIEKGISGTIHFFRPSDKKLDFEISLTPTQQFPVAINHETLTPGSYKIFIDWQSGENKYYKEMIAFY